MKPDPRNNFRASRTFSIRRSPYFERGYIQVDLPKQIYTDRASASTKALLRCFHSRLALSCFYYKYGVFGPDLLAHQAVTERSPFLDKSRNRRNKDKKRSACGHILSWYLYCPFRPNKASANRHNRDGSMNEKLRSARRRQFGSLEKAAAACGVSEKSLRRWEQGTAKPNWESLQCLCRGFGMTPEALGFGELIGDQEAVPPVVHALKVREEMPPHQEGFQVGEATFLSQLHASGEETMTAFDPSKRRTLEKITQASGILAATQLLQPEPWNKLLAQNQKSAPQPLEENELRYFNELVATCWKLSSAQLQSVEQLLPIFLPAVEHTMAQPSEHQHFAAGIACQAEQLASIVALHQDNLPAMEMHRQRAVYYGQISGDVNLYIAAIMRLATTYYYLKRPKKARETYQQAIPYLERITPLLRARTYIGMAEAAARNGLEQEALTYRTKAHEAFPDHPEQDASAVFADASRGTLALWESLTYMELGQPGEAAATLMLVRQKPTLLLPERVRIELVNHEAQATIAQRRLDESVEFVRTGVTGALKLESQKRYSEAYDNYQVMRLLWPRERRVKDLA
jgi:transcriptional regulator with XRE-family HTH domain